MDEAAVEIRHLTVYPVDASRPILDDIDLVIHQGSFVALCGGNGAGKTTLGRVLVRLQPVDQGHMFAFGHPLDDVPPETIQMMFQPPAAQVLGDTVYEELAITIVASEHDTHQAERLQKIRDICTQVGLDVPINTPVMHLSGGQLARLCLAQTLHSGANVLILDEAFGEIDPAAKHQFLLLLRKIADQGKTILLVTHDMEDVLHADRVLVLDEGRLVEDCGAPLFFYGDGLTAEPPACVRYGFELPYLVKTAMALNSRLQRRFTPLCDNDLMEAFVHGTAP